MDNKLEQAWFHSPKRCPTDPALTSYMQTGFMLHCFTVVLRDQHT